MSDAVGFRSFMWHGRNVSEREFLQKIGHPDMTEIFINEKTGEKWIGVSDFAYGAKEIRKLPTPEKTNAELALDVYAQHTYTESYRLIFDVVDQKIAKALKDK